MDLELTDRVIVVTGASKGIGFATSEALLKEGARVVLIARDANRLDIVSKKLNTTFDASRFLFKLVRFYYSNPAKISDI